jgi:hypothetical protein
VPVRYFQYLLLFRTNLEKKRSFIPTAFHFSSECATREVLVDQQVLKLNQLYRLAVTVELSTGENTNFTKKSAEVLVVAGKWVDLEVMVWKLSKCSCL